jgi:hypothetical protein
MRVLISNETVVKTNVLPKSVVSALLEDLESRHVVTKMSGHCTINIDDEYEWGNMIDIYNTIISHAGVVEGTAYNRLVYCFAEDALPLSEKKSDIPNLDNEYVKYIFASDNLQTSDDNCPTYARIIDSNNVRNMSTGNNWPIKSDNGVDYYFHRFSQQNGYFCTIRLLEKDDVKNTVSFAIELHIVKAGNIDYHSCKVQQIFYIREFPIPKGDRPLGILNRAIEQFGLKESRSLKSLIIETETAASKILAYLNRTKFYPIDQDATPRQLSEINLKFKNIVTNASFIGYDNQTFNMLIEQYPQVAGSRKLRETKSQDTSTTVGNAITPRNNKYRGSNHKKTPYKNNIPDVVTYNIYLDPDTPYSVEIPTKRYELVTKILAYNHIIMTLENNDELFNEIRNTECDIRRTPTLVERIDTASNTEGDVTYGEEAQTFTEDVEGSEYNNRSEGVDQNSRSKSKTCQYEEEQITSSSKYDTTNEEYDNIIPPPEEIVS